MGMNDDDARVHDALRKLENDLKSIKPSRVLLVGDIMMDCYIHGFANNLNSRAPVPVLKEISRDEDVGAAAHVARGLDSLGLSSQLHGVIGDDAPGLAVLDMLDEEGVDTSGIAVLEDRITTVKTRLLGAREGLVRGEQLLRPRAAQRTSRHGLYEDAQRSTGRRPQALQAKGHGTGQTGFYSFSLKRRRRRLHRPEAQGLGEQEHEPQGGGADPR